MATVTHRATLIGVFDTPQAAHRAVEELHRAGFGSNQIMLMAHHTELEKEEITDLDAAKAAQLTGDSKVDEGAAIGAVAGGVLGGAIAVAVLAIPGLGPVLLAGSLLNPATIAALLTGIGGGLAGGGIVGALVGLDFPEDEALLYERELKAGRALVAIHAGSRSEVAWEILRTCGGQELGQEIAAEPHATGL
jgi:hypothetical protein